MSSAEVRNPVALQLGKKEVFMLDSIYSKLKEKMDKTVHVLVENFKTIRSGKATPSMVENIIVDYYGNRTPLKQMATITAQESKSIVIQPWDKSALESIEKTLLSSDIGVTPVNDGRVVRLTFPPLSKEQRENFAKIVHKNGEDAKISIRNIRRDGIHEIDKKEKDDHLSKDMAGTGKKEIQKITDDYIEKIDKLVERKTEEIMEV